MWLVAALAALLPPLWLVAALAACVLHRLREDVNSASLMQQTRDDAKKSRMSEPVPVGDVDLSAIRISQRFAVDQGLKSDGTPKIRCVDSCTESGINPCTEASEHLSLDGLDDLIEIMKFFRIDLSTLPHLLKVDVNAAYRRVPVNAEDRWAAHVAFQHLGTTYIAGHLAMPFGATSSVFAWDRIGAAIVCICRVVLKIPVLRYVDDLFSAERPECVVHARDCIVRLIRALLGADSVSEDKVSSGLPLEILGVTVDADLDGVAFWPSEKKVSKWSSEIAAALASKQLLRGPGKKLAGKLSWSAQYVFQRLGRAMLRPLYNIGRGVSWSAPIESALAWWQQVLELQIHQHRRWVLPDTRPVQLLCDARGSPPRLAAVVYTHDGRSFYTDMEPPQALLDFFLTRGDSQIAGLELAAIALGLCTFGEHFVGQKVRVWSDNCVSECATRRGSAKAWDHNQIVHSLWTKAAALKCYMRVDRVPTELNISDLPSRMEYKLLQLMGTQFVEPELDEMFWSETAWSPLVVSDPSVTRWDGF